jgi:hypothetical protein
MRDALVATVVVHRISDATLGRMYVVLEHAVHPSEAVASRWSNEGKVGGRSEVAAFDLPRSGDVNARKCGNLGTLPLYD